jgi:hypothetical protein
MPTPTYIALANTTLATASSSVTFSSIPATFRDLICVASILGSATDIQGRIRLNSDTGGNYNWSRITGPGGSAPTADSATGATEGRLAIFAQANASNRAQYKFEILDYSATDKHKNIVNRADQAVDSSAAGTELFITRWANTAAVTSVEIRGTGNFAIGSTLALYGVIA